MRFSRLVLLMFLVVQAFDGVFTYVAVDAVGTHAESNHILVFWMTLLGPGLALFIAKAVAMAAGAFVYHRGLHTLLAVLTLLYAVVAIGPWLYVYTSWP
ncbi:MAG TPA: hypothetical protein VG736_12420 [Vicinamibacterales bacterium]|jgi:hypothetical protein|nr:hypothetical protein [Vicinamibacterales bacterium]